MNQTAATPTNCVTGKYACKHHKHAHSYVRHTLCGHEFCPQAWLHCPCCHGSELNNQTPAKQREDRIAARIRELQSATSLDEFIGTLVAPHLK